MPNDTHIQCSPKGGPHPGSMMQTVRMQRAATCRNSQMATAGVTRPTSPCSSTTEQTISCVRWALRRPHVMARSLQRTVKLLRLQVPLVFVHLRALCAWNFLLLWNFKLYTMVPAPGSEIFVRCGTICSEACGGTRLVCANLVGEVACMWTVHLFLVSICARAKKRRNLEPRGGESINNNKFVLFVLKSESSQEWPVPDEFRREHQRLCEYIHTHA